MALFAFLSIFMVVASYLFVIILAGACVYLPYWLMMSSDSPNGQVILLFIFGAIIAGAMLWSLIPRPDRFKPPGLLIESASQPRLFAELENIAGSLNEPMPSEVYLIGDVNAWVADRGAGLALALIDHGWTLHSGPGVFHLQRDAEQLNPFVVLDQLMSGKLSAQDWIAKCNALAISRLVLAPAAQRQLDLLDGTGAAS